MKNKVIQNLSFFIGLLLLTTFISGCAALRKIADQGNDEPNSALATTVSEINAVTTNYSIQYIGVHQSKSEIDNVINVDVEISDRPIVLIVTAYNSVTWKINLAKDVKLLRVIASGYEKQKVIGVGVDKVFSCFSENGTKEYLYGYSPESPANSDERLENESVESAIRGLFKKPVTVFQGKYYGEKFTVDGKAKTLSGVAAEISMLSTEYSLHYIRGSKPENGIIDVEINLNDKPLVLILSAKDAVTWNVQADSRVEILKVIATGYKSQSIIGIDPEKTFTCSVENSDEEYIDSSSSREIDSKIDELFQKEIATYQQKNNTNYFSVDGEPKRLNEVATQIKGMGIDYDIHYIGVYSSESGTIDVDVKNKHRPVVLFLTAYDSVDWKINPIEGVQILKVIASGYHKQSISGVDPKKIFTCSNETYDEDAFYENESQILVTAEVNTLFNKDLISFQNGNSCSSFSVIKPISSIIKEINEITDDYQVHYISVYDAKNIGGRVNITLKETEKPYVLILTAFDLVQWSILGDYANVIRVILSGHEKQLITGISKDKVFHAAYKDGYDYPSYFTYKNLTSDIIVLGNISSQVEKAFTKPLHYFQIQYEGRHFNLPPTRIVEIDTYSSHSMLITEKEELFVAGTNSHGELGVGDTADRLEWTRSLTGVKKISCGSNHSFAITQDGSLWGTGLNNYGQLGIGTLHSKHGWVAAGDAEEVVAGSSHSMAIMNAKSLFTTGSYDYSYAYNPTVHSNWYSDMENIKAIASNQSFSFCLKEDGSLWAKGMNSYGQLGLGEETILYQSDWAQVLTDVKAISAGSFHSLALKEDGTLWAVGNNQRGQLGTGNDLNSKDWVQVLSDIKAIEAGKLCSLVINNDDELLYVGELISGYQSNNWRVILRDIVAVSAGDSILAIRKDGSLWVKGKNSYGELGIVGTKTGYSGFNVFRF
jgi:alpha-tubulin suppressor-like RCC1 family protein